jgi:hypothetical protein
MMSNGGSGKTESVIPFGFKLNLRSETADPLAKFLRSALARPVNPTSGIQFYFDPARFEIGDHVRKHLGNDPVSVAFIAACTGHHIPFWYSLGKTCSRASSGCLVSAMTTMFGSAIPCSLAVLQSCSNVRRLTYYARSCASPQPMRSPTTTRPVAIPTRVCSAAWVLRSPLTIDWFVQHVAQPPTILVDGWRKAGLPEG